jgi:hypothetical protein
MIAVQALVVTERSPEWLTGHKDLWEGLMTTDQIAEEITDAYDAAVSDLSLEDAMEVAEQVAAYMTGALAGLREDQKQADS